jgi:hypothetical protein
MNYKSLFIFALICWLCCAYSTKISANIVYTNDVDKPVNTVASDTVPSTQEVATFVPTPQVLMPQKEYPKVTFMFNAGHSWRTARMSKDLDDFQRHVISQIRAGFVWSGSVSYYFANSYGVGLILNQYMSSAQAFGTYITTGQVGELKFRDRITYFGPSFTVQTALGYSAWILDMNVGFGYIRYNRRENFINQNTTASGSSLGSHMDIGFSYRITPNISIGFKVHTASGSVHKMTVIDEYGQRREEELDTAEGLAHIGISGGFRFYIR